MRRLGIALIALIAAAGCGDRQAAGPAHDDFPKGAAAKVAPVRTDPPLGAAVTWSVLQRDPELAAVVPRAFSSITPENDMKLERLEPEQGRFDFGDADRLVNWARAHDLRIRGHTMIWHQQVPEWLSTTKWSAAELRGVLDRTVRTIVGHFRGRVDTWDVVNEPFTDQGRFRTSAQAPWLRTLGPEYIETALHAARAADPTARLFVNEIGAESGGPKLDALVKLVKDLERRGAPIDGIGLEAHLDGSKPPSRAVLERSLRRLAATGVKVEITELDVAARGISPEQQAAVYRDVGEACAAVAACDRLTVWGVSDEDSWIGAAQRPLLFDGQLRPKPAWPALTDALDRGSS